MIDALFIIIGFLIAYYLCPPKGWHSPGEVFRMARDKERSRQNERR